jgi:branched-chain amino acid transport system permease protein
MESLLLFVLLGIGPGGLIAGIALSVVLTYRGSGVINIAAGAMAMVGAYLFYGLRTDGYVLFSVFDLGAPLSTAPALLLTLALCAALGWVFDAVVYRPLRTSPPVAKLVASVGVLLFLQAVIVLRFGGNGQAAPQVLGGGAVDMLGGAVPTSRFILMGMVLAVAAGLAAIYRYTRFGLATRAAQEHETEAMHAGLSPSRLSGVNGMLAAVVAGALGVIVAPLTQLDPITLTLAVVPALGAALLARFTSFTVAALAGLGMGVIQAVVTYLQTKAWFPTTGGLPMPGVPQLIYFLIIAVALIWRGKSLPVRGSLVEPRLPAAPVPVRLLRPAAIGAVVVVIAFLLLPYDFRQALIISLIGSVACLSLVVVTGFVGQVSLAQFALAGVSGLTVSKFATDLGIGFPLGPLAGIVVATLFGLVMALPVLRVRGVQFTIVTLAAAVAIEAFGFDNASFGGGVNGSPVPEPTLFGLDLGTRADFPINGGQLPSPVFGFGCLAVLIVVALAVGLLRRSSLGQEMLAVRSSERASAGSGLSPGWVKLVAFGIGGAIAAVAGVLYAYNFGSVDTGHFGLLNALSLVAFAYLGGITTIKGSLIAGFLITGGVGSHILEAWFGVPTDYQLLVAGIALVATIVMNPSGIALQPPPRWARALSRRIGGLRGPGGAATAAAGDK